MADGSWLRKRLFSTADRLAVDIHWENDSWLFYHDRLQYNVMQDDETTGIRAETDVGVDEMIEEFAVTEWLAVYFRDKSLLATGKENNTAFWKLLLWFVSAYVSFFDTSALPCTRWIQSAMIVGPRRKVGIQNLAQKLLTVTKYLHQSVFVFSTPRGCLILFPVSLPLGNISSQMIPGFYWEDSSESLASILESMQPCAWHDSLHWLMQVTYF